MKVFSRHPDLLSAAAAAALSVIGAVIGAELWHMTSSVPVAYNSDGQLFLAITKATLENGWYLTNPDLGFPLGSEWFDYPVPSGDSLQLLLLHAISVFSDSYVVVLHVFYVLGFALVAVSAFAVLRLLGISRPPSIVCATLFTLLPYHFTLSEAHPFHTAYWVIPIACFLVLAVLLDRPLFRRREGDHGRLLSFASRTSLATLGACVLIGSAGANYYSVFAAGLLLFAGVVAAIRFDWRRSLATAGVAAAAILAVVALNALPTLIYQAEHGGNDEAAERFPAESEYYSLSLFGILAPSPGHRIGPFDELRQDYVESSPTPDIAAATGIGLVASVGFLWLVFFGLTSILRPASWPERWRLHGAAAAATLIAFLIATTGGFALFFAHLVTPQIRVWHRLHLFIAFFALVAIAALLDLALRRLDRVRRGRALAATLLGVVLVVGFLDQTSPNYVPAYDETRAEFESDGAFVDAIEAELGPDAAVFQLPYVPFPEWWPSSGMEAFDPFRGYLHSADLRWSYGATDGRPENWQPGVVDEGATQLLGRISAAGFDGLTIDRYGYPDNASELEAAIADELGERPLEAPNGRFSFFDLRSYAERVVASPEAESLRSATLSPLVAEPGAGLLRWLPPNGNFSPNVTMTGPTAQLEVVNPSDAPRRATIELAVPPDAPAGVEVAFPDGSTHRAAPGETLRETVTLPPGTSALALEADGDAGPGLLKVRVYDAGLDALAAQDDVAVQP